MKITLICNAGLAIEYKDKTLLIDAPNEHLHPFCGIDETTWDRILRREGEFEKVCGLWFSHAHPDHCDLKKVKRYQSEWPDTPVFIPETKNLRGRGRIGGFEIEYQKIDHAPIPNAPAHVVTWIGTGEGSLYLPADAALDCDAHRAFVKGRKASAAIWNSMYLSRPETRKLMREVSGKNYIYHMPMQRPDPEGYWRKLDRNLERYGSELGSVIILDRCPYVFEI